MNTKFYTILIAAGLAFGACKKDSAPQASATAEGRDTKISLAIPLPKEITTYAADDANATDDEVKINRVDVFIYDNGGNYGLTYASINVADMVKTNGTYAVANITAKTGKKLVYVGVNLPQAVVDELKTSYVNVKKAFNANLTELAGASGVAMFNQAVQEHELTDGVNLITVPVTRLVSKIVVSQKASLALSVAGGTLSDLKFAMGNTNTRMFVAPLVNWVDPNHAESSYAAGLFSTVNTANYVAVNAGGTAILTANKQYAQENTSAMHRHMEVTYASVSAKFSPAAFEDNTATQNADGTFYAVFTTGGTYYFKTAANADAFIAANSATAAPAKLTYTGGICYYRIYLNPDGGVATGGKYDVVRNVLYNATIAKVNALGTPGPNDIAGTPGTPTNPGAPVVAVNPTTPQSPVSPLTDNVLSVEMKVTSWNVSTADYELY